MESIFREYDIRGIFDKELNEDIVKKIGFFLGKRIKKIGDFVGIGYDARSHSLALFEWLKSGFNEAKIIVLDMKMVPTPVNYFSNFCKFKIDNSQITPAASVMITGSHNPPEYNGFKITIDKKPFFGKEIYSLAKDVLESEIKIKDFNISYFIDAKQKYIDYMIQNFKHIANLDRKIAIDCGNGVAGVVLEPIFDSLGLDYVPLYCNPDGTFPNHHPDPSVEENLKDLKSLLKDVDFGFAYDGDGDRVAFLTKEHNFKGDELAIIFAKNIENPYVIGEVKCSQVMYDEIDKFGKTFMYKTGHSNLKIKIKELNASLAAEVSGHIFFADRYFGYDDAIYATLRILELIKNGVDFDLEIKKLPKVYNTPEIKIETTEEKKFEIIKSLKEALKNPPSSFPKIRKIIDIDGVRIVFDKGWALVRASNTTPVLVTRFEAVDKEMANLYQEKILEILKKIV